VIKFGVAVSSVTKFGVAVSSVINFGVAVSSVIKFGVVVSSVIRKPAHEADSLLPGSDDVQNVRSCTSLPPYTLITFSVVVPKDAQGQLNIADS
jgi:hypothetical protein